MTIDQALLYSQCPMRYYMSTYLGISNNTVTFSGQLDSIISTCIYSYAFREIDINALAVAMRRFDKLSEKIVLPTEVRGSPKKKQLYDEKISTSREKLRYALGIIHDLAPEDIIGSPYQYELNIDGTIVEGIIDIIMIVGGVHHVVTLDMHHTYPSEDYLNRGIKCTIACNVFKKLLPEPREYKLIHFNIYNNYYAEVQRNDSQLTSIDYELRSIVGNINRSIGDGQWYRAKSLLCNSCYANSPCEDLYRRLSNYG